MTVETHADVTATPNALPDDRAVWTAPVLQRFDTVSAEGPGSQLYGDAGYAIS